MRIKINMEPNKGIEFQILEEWKEWDTVDFYTICFYNAKLKIDAHPFKKGDIIKQIIFDFQNSVIEIEDTLNDKVHSYDMILSIKKNN